MFKGLPILIEVFKIFEILKFGFFFSEVFILLLILFI